MRSFTGDSEVQRADTGGVHEIEFDRSISQPSEPSLSGPHYLDSSVIASGPLAGESLGDLGIVFQEG
ncbi:MAG: hypothetical protein L3J82_05630 [Planctomycetes bacterium]|nr:hypothetical protein [Planctomycetota bacterium]